MSARGALISPELSARVHWSLGRVSGATAVEAGGIGTELITAIQAELELAYHRGADTVRNLTPGGGGASPSSSGSAGVGVVSYPVGGAIV